MRLKATWCFISIFLALSFPGIPGAFAEDQPLRGGSTMIQPLKNVSPNTPFTVTTTEASNLQNLDYSTLPVCPQNPICPDINGKYPPGGSIATCPDKCTVTRKVQQHTVGPVTIIDNYIPAVCPLNFVKLADYNMQQEIATITNPRPITEIPDVPTLNRYRNAGFSCTLYPAGTQRYCAFSTTWPPYTTTNNPAIYFNVDTTIIDGYAGQYTGYKQSAECYIGTVPSACAVNLVVSCGIIHTRIYDNYYAYYECAPPKSRLYYTSNLAPASAVCSSYLPKWKVQ